MYQNFYGVKAMEKIRLFIAGEEYNIATDDDLDYVAQLGQELDKKITGIMSSHSRISVTQAAKKSEVTSENLRGQIQEYLEDAARARTDNEIARREIERLTKELAAARAAK